MKRKSYLIIERNLVPLGSTYYTVDKKSFAVTEKTSNGNNNVDYEYYFLRKKDAEHFADCLELQKLLMRSICISAIRKEESTVWDSIRVFATAAEEKITPYINSKLKEHDFDIPYDELKQLIHP